MTKHPLANLAASVRERLLDRSRESGSMEREGMSADLKKDAGRDRSPGVHSDALPTQRISSKRKLGLKAFPDCVRLRLIRDDTRWAWSAAS